MSTNILCSVQKRMIFPNPRGKFCWWALIITINVSLVICQLPKSQFGKMPIQRKFGNLPYPTDPARVGNSIGPSWHLAIVEKTRDQ